MSTITRILGGSPVAVLVKLVLFSLLVGWFLHWLDWTPFEVWAWIRELAVDGWYSLGTFRDYILVGAMIVVPVFVVMRILAFRR